jgi:branched-chain amino acid transport system permease protein
MITDILNILVNGLITGSIYAILAIGFSLIFGVAQIVNIAHTAFYMLASYVIYSLTVGMGINPVFAMLISVVLVTTLGIVCYKLIIEPIRERETAVLIATIALAMVFQEVLVFKFGNHYLTVFPLLEGRTVILGVTVTYQKVLTFWLAIIFLGILWTWLLKSRTGLAIRATAQDREVANLMGINEGRVAVIAMGVSIALAALAGGVVAPTIQLEPQMWMGPLVMMMAAVVLGGMGSIKGSFVGAFILGFTEVTVSTVFPHLSFLKVSVALLIMVVVLVIRPEGLYGVFFEEER